MTYAKHGHLFFRVQTPTVFTEVELPDAYNPMTPEQWDKYESLWELARAHGTVVLHSNYRLG